MAESFEQLRLEFLAETEDTLEALQHDLNRLGQAVGRGAPEAQIVDRVFRATHSLKGVAGMFGLDDMSAVSHAMESVFEQLREGRLPFDDAALDLLYRGNESLHRLLAHASGRTSGDPHTAAEKVIREVERHLEEHAPTSDSIADDDPLAATLPHLGEVERDAVRAAYEAEKTIAVVEAIFPATGYEEPFRNLLEGIRTWGTVHGSAPSDRSEATETIRVRVVVSGSEELFGLMRAVGPMGAEVLSCDPRATLGRPPASDSGISIVERAPDDVDSSSSFEPISAASLRVPVERVDRLLSELGELIQAKMGLDNSALEILAASRDRMRKTTFQQALRNLDRKIRILQDEILSVRMVPLDATFQMLERALREICRSTGKEARFVTTGAPVNLDKQVVEALTEPLVHLVRNAVDHGLDDTETRIQRGKPRVGTVKIDARPEGGYTVLEVSDDGSGLDLERIKQKARRMGLFREGESPTRAELLDVIFQPGFTVRDEATSVSGRGFGLDVVRAAVAGLGGLLNVDTRPGSTVFRLRVPTTLAITRALLVEAGGQPFFIPLASVDRVRPVHPREIERVGDEEVLVLEKRAIPVCNLAELLGLPGVDQLQGPPPGVFLGLADRRLVVLVDRLGGQQEIVVRGLGSLLPAVPGISGATTRGDGRTVLILDPAAILELAARVKAPVSP